MKTGLIITLASIFKELVIISCFQILSTIIQHDNKFNNKIKIREFFY